jgi:hypothetical protein
LDVVTAVGAVDDRPIRTGDLLATVSGVPLVAFETAVPFYRDLVVGSKGPDVELLEKTLAGQGLIRSGDRVLDQAAADALRSVYSKHGLESADGFVLRSSVSVPPGSAVAQTHAAVGDVVEPGSALLSLASESGEAVCELPETAQVKAGDPVVLVGGSERQEATVAAVDEPEEGTRSMRVKAVGGGRVLDGATAELVLEATAGEVLTVPVTAIHVAADGGPELRLLGGGEPVAAKVTTGVSAGGWVEVEGGGLAAGTPVEVQAGQGGDSVFDGG